MYNDAEKIMPLRKLALLLTTHPHATPKQVKEPGTPHTDMVRFQ